MVTTPLLRLPLSLVAVAALLLGLVAPTPAGAEPASELVAVEDLSRMCDEVTAERFRDVPAGNVHRDAIGCMAGMGVVEGYGDGTFRPQRNVNRAELASLVIRGLRQSGADLPAPTASFPDVPQDGVHRGSIETLATTGILKGYADGTFRPTATVTRGETAAYLARAFEYRTGIEIVGAPNRFSDDLGFFGPEINKIAALGITRGNDGRYLPGQTLPRDEIASFVARLLESIAANTPATPGPTPSPEPSPEPSPAPENEPPTIDEIDDQDATEGETFGPLTIVAEDPDDGPEQLEVTVTDLPDGLEFDETSLEISGTPTAGSAGNYTVQVEADDGEDPVQELFSLRVLAADVPPAAPTALTATGGEEQVSLSWTAPADDDVASYDVYRSTGSDVDVSGSPLNADPITGTSYLDTPVEAGTTYFYVVTATDDAGNTSDASESASATPTAAPDTTAPSDVVLDSVARVEQVELTWTGGTDDGAVTFDVFRSDTAGVDTTDTPLAADVISPYLDTKVAAGTGYFYVVVATDEAGNSTTSNEVAATPSAPEPCPPVSTLPCDDLKVALPYALEFSGDEGGLSDTDGDDLGFTLVDDPSLRSSTDQAPAPSDPSFPDVVGYEPGLLDVDGGNLTITATRGIQFAKPNGDDDGLASSGTAGTNAQLNGLGVAVQTEPGVYELTTSLVAPDFTNTDGFSQQAGLWWFVDEDNYIKLVVSESGADDQFVQLALESFDAPTADAEDGFAQVDSAAFATGQDVALRMEIDTVAGVVRGYYAVAGGTEVQVTDENFDELLLPAVLAEGGALIDEADPTVGAGIFATKRAASASQSLTATFADFGVTLAPATAELTADPAELDLAADVDGTDSATVAVDASFDTIDGVAVATSQPWLSAAAQGGATSTPLTLDVTADATGLTAGEYTGEVTVSGTDVEDVVVPVSFTVSDPAADFAASINFNSETGTQPDGYERDYGQAFGDRGNGLTYGWITTDTGEPVSLVGQGRDRGSSQPDQRLDTVIHMEHPSTPPTGFWEIAVPDGSYEVTVAAGDPNVGTDPEIHRVNAEDVNLIDDFEPTGPAGSDTRHTTETATVNVVDGALTLDYAGGEGVNTKLDYVEVTRLGEVVDGAPEFGNLPNRSAMEGQSFRAPVPTSDPEGGAVTVTLSDGPGWLSWDAAQGVLLGDVPSDAGGTTETIEVTATDDGGASATATFDLELLDTLSIDVNFQAEGAPTPTGYLADFGESFGLRGEPSSGLSYGWVDPATGDPQSMVGNARDRERSPDVPQLNDTILHMQYGDIGTVYDGTPDCSGNVCDEGAWEIALPDGAYEVTLAVGDQPGGGGDVYDSLHAINLESHVAVEGFQGSASQEYLTVTTQVGVADGALTVSAEGGANTKINYIEIDSLGQLPFADTPNPANRSSSALLDTNVSTSVSVPGAGYGVDPSADSVNSDTITLFEVVEGGEDVEVPATFGSTGGNDTISVAPADNLTPNTTYRFVIDGVIDENGYEFLPYTSLFTTGEDSSTGGGDETFEPVEGVDFESVDLGIDDLFFTTLKVHEGYLWATTVGQGMYRYPVLDDGTLGAQQAIDAMVDRAAIGMVFDQDDPSVAWVTNATDNTSSESSQFSSKVTRVDFGDDLDDEAAVTSPTLDDVIVGLPRSLKDHLSNSLAYGPSGDGGDDWLYFLQGSNQAAGSADTAWGTRGETVLSAAVLRFDPQEAWATVQTDGAPIDVQSEDGGSYDPYAPDAPLELYATGVRNAYDLLFHSNGHLYVPTNGTAGGSNNAVSPGVEVDGSTLTQTAVYTGGGEYAEAGRDVTDICTDNRIDGQAYTGPQVPSSTHPTQRDFLFDVVQGGYYGHPNPDRCEWVLNNGGDPVFDGQDGTGYGPDVDPDRNYRGFAYNFEFNKSPNGVIEYTSDTFGGALQGRMMVVRFSGNNDILTMQVADDGQVLGAQGGETIGGFKTRGNGEPYLDPLDVTEDTTVNPGNLYMNQYARGNPGAQKLFLLRVPEGQQASDLDVVAPQDAVTTDDLIMSATLNDEDPTDTDTVTLSNNGTEDLAVTGSVTGTDSGDVSLGPVGTVPAGGSVDVEVTFDPGGSTPSVRTATLVFTAGDDTAELDVRALAHQGQEGGEEPTLQQVMDTFEYGLDSGWSGLAGGTDPAPVGDEETIDLFERASAGPVTMTPVAGFAPFESLPFGWYPDTDGAASLNELGVVDDGQQQTLIPTYTSPSVEFDPGTDPFGVYYDSNFFDRVGYTEDARNTGVSHRARIYPLAGDNYLVAFEDASNGDYQDYVFVLENVVAAGDDGGGGDPTGDAVQINFQSQDAPVPDGYLRDFGQPYGARTDTDQGDGLTYGWVDDETLAPLDLVGNGRDRGSNDDQRLDTLMHMDLPPDNAGGTLQDGSWELALADGSYEVTVSVGDPDFGGADENHVINVEDVEAIAGFPKAPDSVADGSDERHQQATVQVEVVDGNLTVDQIGGTNTKINYLEVTPLTGGDTVAQVNFQPAGSSTPTDWVADSGELFTTARGYGWVDTEGSDDKTADTRDRAEDTDPLDGTLIIVDDATVGDVVNGEWEYVLADGTYEVTVSVGDPGFADSTHGVSAEGTSVISGFTPAAAGDYQTGTASVEVTDGALTLSSTGTNTKFQWVRISTTGDGSDVVPPRVEINLAGDGSDGVFTGDVAVDLDITDASLEFVDVVVDGTPRSDIDASNYGDGFTVSGAGSHTVEVTATDGAGNSTTETASFEIIVLGDGDLTLDNPEDAPFEDRLVMSRIQNSNGTSNSSDTAEVVVGNTGSEAFDISSLDTADDSFEVIGATDPPITVEPGDEVTVQVQFVGVGSGDNQNFESELVIGHNASDGPTTVVELAGSWQVQEEGGNEPTLAQIAALYGLGTTVVGPGESINNEGRLEAIGDEVLSEYWERADTSEPVTARQLAAYHGAPGANSLRWHPQGNKGGGQTVLTHDGDWAQTLRPRINGSDTAPAVTAFTPAPEVFALAVSQESSAWTTNNTSPDDCNPDAGDQDEGGCQLGHHFRLWQVEDRTGNPIPNTYLASMDFAGINYDFQDNVYLISNIRAATPEETTPPATPGNVAASVDAGDVTVTWDAVGDDDLSGYQVERATSPSGPWTRLTGIAVAGTSFVDTSPPSGEVSYRVLAEDVSGNTSTPSDVATVEVADGGRDAIRINAGGPQVTTGGVTWEAQAFGTGGKTYVNDEPDIAETTDDVLFHSEYSTETGAESFDIPVADGQWEVVLHFAEIYFQSPGGTSAGGIGSRVFDVEVEGQLELDDYDIIEDVGSTTAVSYSYIVDVADGQVDIDLTSVTNQAKISAIEVIPFG